MVSLPYFGQRAPLHTAAHFYQPQPSYNNKIKYTSEHTDECSIKLDALHKNASSAPLANYPHLARGSGVGVRRSHT